MTFFEPYPQIEILHEDHAITAHGPSWTAKVHGKQSLFNRPRLFRARGLSGSDAEAEAWRVACAAWWAAHPEQAVTPNIQGHSRGLTYRVKKQQNSTENADSQ